MENSDLIVVSLQSGDNAIENLQELSKKPTVRSNGFDGLSIVDIILTVSSASIFAICKVVTANINAKKYISIKYRGVEIKGVSEEKLIKILETVQKTNAK